MAIYDWPTTRTFLPQTAELRVVDNSQRSLESPLSGFVQTLSMPGARWGWGFDFGAHADAERDALEAYLLRLSGREHRVRLWDLKRPRPRGSIQLSGVTLGATAAQFATTLQLAGCRGANALLGGSFETDADGNGVADGWVRYESGIRSGLSASVPSGGTVGAKSQYLAATTLGPSSTDQQGVWRSGVPVSHLAGRAVTMAVQAYGSSGQCAVLVEWYSAGATLLGTLTATAAIGPADWTPIVATGTAPAGAVTASVYLYQHSATAGAQYLWLDAAQLVAGSAGQYPGPATLLAGDWIGLSTGQLVRVVADAAATDLGGMTVDVRHMLRSSVASGSAVTLDKPTALYVRTEAGLALPRMPGLAAPGMSAEFVEVFA